MNARFYWFSFSVGFGLFVMGMHALLHGFNPDKIADQVEPQDRWYIIVLLICALPFHSETSGVWLMWSALLPALINPPKVQQYAVEMEGHWRELLLLIPYLIVFLYLETTMH